MFGKRAHHRPQIQSNDTGNGEVPQSTTETAAAGDIPAAPYPNTEPINLSLSPSAGPQAIEGEDVDDLNRVTKDLTIASRPNSPLPENELHNLEARPSVLGSDSAAKSTREASLYDDPSTDEDDGSGEWITPDNVALHKSRALGLVPSSDGDPKKRCRVVDEETVLAGCMTADFAMQNVLLQMGLALVGTEGKQIQKVKTWVLRCHACFK